MELMQITSRETFLGHSRKATTNMPAHALIDAKYTHQFFYVGVQIVADRLVSFRTLEAVHISRDSLSDPAFSKSKQFSVCTIRLEMFLVCLDSRVSRLT